MQDIIKSLRSRNISAYDAKDREEAKRIMLSLIPKGSRVSFGGSKTLEAIGILDTLRAQQENYSLMDRDILSKNSFMKHFIMKTGSSEGVYLSGTNAITEDGMIVNMDGWGNRVNAIAYGPDKVIIAVGKNKIVKDLDAARKRIGDLASPQNTKRLNKDTPCAKTGRCIDCRSPERICNILSVIMFQNDPERMHVIMIDEDLGY